VVERAVDDEPLTRDRIFAILDAVMDPEVPVLSVVELGIVRDVRVDEGGATTVVVTPTYSGCPAMHVIEADILRALHAAGVPSPRVETVYAPAWTTDWIAPPAREKLRAYGIAPPGPAPVNGDLITLTRRAETVRCPYCASTRTTLKSEFGSTACKSILYCDDCRQPFEQFKAL
jgi:ring-1,2-phenylacetyl-CoA epoxidase subunit PaaD